MRFNKFSILEKEVVEFFKENLHKISSPAKVVKVHNDVNHKVDLWIEYKSHLIPFEFKRGAINENALLQISNYMDYYGCDYGVLVGSELKCNLPNNIGFINFLDYMDLS